LLFILLETYNTPIVDERKENTSYVPESSTKFDEVMSSALAHLAQRTAVAKDRTFVFFALGNSLFPRLILGVGRHLGQNEDQVRKYSTVVKQNPRLKKAYDDTLKHLEQLKLIQATDLPDKKSVAPSPHKPPTSKDSLPVSPGDIVYNHRWDENAHGKPGVSRERFKLIGTEHTERFQGMPADLANLGEHLGKISKQRVSELWQEVEKRGELPPGLTKRKAKGGRLPKTAKTNPK